MNTTFYICRHGQTDNNKKHRLMGWIDTPLTDAGIANAHSSANKLKAVNLDAILSSDLGRAFTTAYIISRDIGYTEEILRYLGLREANYGDLANLSHDDPKLSQLGDTSYVSPNGESLKQMQARVIECLQSINADYDGKTILIVAHDGTINAVRSYMQKRDFEPSDDLTNEHDFVGRFVMSNGSITSFEEYKST